MNSSKQDEIAETFPIYMYIHTYVCIYIFLYNIQYLYKCICRYTYVQMCIYIYIKSKLCVFPAIVNTVILQIVDHRAPASLSQVKNISSYF